jgi:hypothetical protein
MTLRKNLLAPQPITALPILGVDLCIRGPGVLLQSLSITAHAIFALLRLQEQQLFVQRNTWDLPATVECHPHPRKEGLISRSSRRSPKIANSYNFLWNGLRLREVTLKDMDELESGRTHRYHKCFDKSTLTSLFYGGLNASSGQSI